MNCFACAEANDSVAAVGVCRHCGVGLCHDHLIEAAGYRVGGTAIGCGHDLARVKPLVRAPAGVAAAARHHGARAAR
jgi:hypothetical protein